MRLPTMKLVVPPAAEPVTVAEARAQVRRLDDEEDAYLLAATSAARQYVEQVAGIQLMPATWRATLDKFPTPAEWWEQDDGSAWQGMERGVATARRRGIPLRRSPVLSVTSVVYVGADGQDVTLDPTQYKVLADEQPGLVVPSYAAGNVWPMARDEPGAVRITYVAGWPTRAEVPEPLKAYIKALLGLMYEQRAETVTGTIQTRIDTLAGLWEPWRVYA